jgi:hypothetical protein
VILGNAQAWAIEFYIRHLSGEPFYDIARRGAFAELVDIGDYIQRHTRPDEAVYINIGAYRRIIYFLTGRKDNLPIMISRGVPRETEIRVRRWDDTSRLYRVFKGIPAEGRYVIVFSEQSAWPEFHLPLRRAGDRWGNALGAQGRSRQRGQAPSPISGESWWRLYERLPNGTFVQVTPPRSREYVRAVPPAGI